MLVLLPRWRWAVNELTLVLMIRGIVMKSPFSFYVLRFMQGGILSAIANQNRCQPLPAGEAGREHRKFVFFQLTNHSHATSGCLRLAKLSFGLHVAYRTVPHRS
jgi:hypothetical protein